jgi:hypothetical protein
MFSIGDAATAAEQAAVSIGYVQLVLGAFLGFALAVVAWLIGEWISGRPSRRYDALISAMDAVIEARKCLTAELAGQDGDRRGSAISVESTLARVSRQYSSRRRSHVEKSDEIEKIRSSVAIALEETPTDPIAVKSLDGKLSVLFSYLLALQTKSDRERRTHAATLLPDSRRHQ